MNEIDIFRILSATYILAFAMVLLLIIWAFIEPLFFLITVLAAGICMLFLIFLLGISIEYLRWNG